MWLLCTIYSCIQVTVNCWITPFGHPGVTGYVLLTPAFRSLSRPSSPYGSQASAINLYSLDHIILSATHFSFSAPRGLFIQASPFRHSQCTLTYAYTGLHLRSMPSVPSLAFSNSFMTLLRPRSTFMRVPDRTGKERNYKQAIDFVYRTHIPENREAILIPFLKRR